MSPYVRRVRERIGSGLLLLPSVTVLVRDGDDRIVLVRQSDSGRWGTVGGAVEPDEDPRDAAVREAREELGVDVELGALVAVLGGPQFRVRYANGDETAYVSIVFDARVGGGARVHPEDGEEILEARWFTPAELAVVDLHDFARASLGALGLLPSS